MRYYKSALYKYTYLYLYRHTPHDGIGAAEPQKLTAFLRLNVRRKRQICLHLYFAISTLHHCCLVGLFYAFITSFTKFIFSYRATDLTRHWRSIQQRTSEASYQILLENCTTLCFWTAQFLILNCKNCILDCTNWVDCTLRISPGIYCVK